MRIPSVATRPEVTTTASAILKVPEVIVVFWIIKLLTTATGESASDYLVFQINPYVAVVLGCIGLAVSLALQLASRRYVAWIYWLTVLMVAVFGTMAADVMHVVMHIPYLTSTIFFAIVLAIVLVTWYTGEKTLSFHSIYAGRRELFYWSTVIATFALGTAAGDMTASTLGLGYFASILLFAVLFAVPGVGYRFFGLNEIAAFWFAYIVTRPLGASVADWLGKRYLGGLGLGDEKVTAVLLVLIVAFVGYLTVTHADIKDGGVEGT
jgi:uncharacterized membrane-anchored protein